MEDYAKFVEEQLNTLLPNKPELIVLAMNNICDQNKMVTTAFKKMYESRAKTLKK